MKRKELVIDCEMDFSAFEHAEEGEEVEIMRCKFYEDGKYAGYLDYKIKVEGEKVRSIIKTDLPPEYTAAFLRTQD